MSDTARDTLTLLMAARPVQNDVMFPDYHDSKHLCDIMMASLSKWEDRDFVDTAILAFQHGDARRGMQLARERVYFYVPNECSWGYLVDR
tara:strand:+ start:471 stop:740 length:270 start_codon:yes stop_codon:yes gene_type:complete